MTEPTRVSRDVLDLLRRGEHVDLELLTRAGDGTYGYEAAAIVSGQTNASQAATYFARLLEKPPVDRPRDYRFSLEELLAVRVSTVDDVDDDFRAWLLGTLPRVFSSPEPPDLVGVWAEDGVGPGAWLACGLVSLEEAVELASEVTPDALRVVDVARARADLEELLPC